MLLEGIFRKRNAKTDLPCCKMGDLWQFSISGDLPVFTFLLSEKELTVSQKKTIVALLEAHAFLALGGVHFDLVFVRKERESYFAPGKKELLALIRQSVGNAFLEKKGGVHLLFSEKAHRILPSFSTVFLFLEEDCVFPALKKAFCSCLSYDEPLDLSPVKKSAPLFEKKEEPILSLPCGSFLKEGFPPKKTVRPSRPFLRFTQTVNSGHW
jgi:hypothetical protein